MIATENWDDDFEFNPNSPPRKNLNTIDADHSRMSTTSSRFTIDWDAELGNSPTDTSPSRRGKVFTAPVLLPSAEAGPSTPVKRLTVTENWDDDFEDTPVRRTRGEQDIPRNYRSMQPLSTNNENINHKSSVTGRHRASSSASAQYTRFKNTFSGDFTVDLDEEEDDPGFMDKDEDRTVTGRSRRPGVGRLSSVTNHPLDSPPPPVPSLPANLTTTGSPQPFPRSPSSSVFSLPTTIAGDSLYYGSTAHLHPASRTSTHLPPKPPATKERERRRLRKKNRPQSQGMFEMLPVASSFSSGLAALDEIDRPQTPVRDSLSRPRTPHTPVSSAPSSPAPSPVPGVNTTPSSNRHGSPPNAPPSTPSAAKNALLSRIGSVKKWGVRRKRVSTTQHDIGSPEDMGRPASSLSSLPLSTTSSHHTPPSRPVSPRSPRQNGGWFFRASDAFSPDSTALESSSSPKHVINTTTASNNSTTNLSLRGRGPRASLDVDRPGGSKSRNVSKGKSKSRPRTPSRSRTPFVGEGAVVNGRVSSAPQTPSKLLKRRSLGFVKRTLTGLGNAEQADGGSHHGGQQRHASYGGVSTKSTGSQFNSSDVFHDGDFPNEDDDGLRGRKKPATLVKGGKKRQDEKDQTQDMGKSFIRSVRRLSIVGRHKRQKSGTPLPLGVGRPSLGSQPESMPLPVQEDGKDTGIQEPPRLLPPVEIEPLPGPQHLSTRLEVPSPAMEAGIRSRPEDAESNVIEPLLPHTPRKTDDPRTPPMSPKRSLQRSPTSPGKGPTSPQSASLGRSTYSPTRKSESPELAVPRRSSLGDLKIPARITQAQIGLRRDLGMVREFAQNVEQLKGLQGVYHRLVVEIQAILDNHAHIHSQYQQQQQLQAARSVSPTFFSRPTSRRRSYTNPGPTPQHVAYKQLASEFYTINSRYRITWECAELLIELGGGSSASTSYGPTTSTSAPVVQGGGNDGSSSWNRRMGRERAITLAGDESRPPSPLPGTKSIAESQSSSIPSSAAAWRASTGRQELTQRQMVLLKELLNSADSSFIGDEHKPNVPILEEPASVNKDWKWGDPSNSTVTLPPSEGGGAISRPPSSAAGHKKRRASRLGMAGLRDLLKLLKRHHTAHPVHPMPSFGSIQASTTSLTSATNSSSEMYSGCPSSIDINHIVEGTSERRSAHGRKRAGTSVGPESNRDLAMSSSLFDSNPLPSRQSRGRPSLASIFRLPNSFKSSNRSQSVAPPDDMDKKEKNTAEVIEGSNAEEDWDRIETPGDLDMVGVALGDGSATVRGRGRSPYLQQPPPSSFGGRTSPRLKVTANSSQTSLYEDSPNSSSHNVRLARLSNVDEDSTPVAKRSSQMPLSRPPPSPSSHSRSNVIAPLNLNPPPRMSSGYFNAKKRIASSTKHGSVRSMPPQPMPELRLAMAPENIKPLLENAREVHARLIECIAEIRALLENHKSLVVPHS